MTSLRREQLACQWRAMRARGQGNLARRLARVRRGVERQAQRQAPGQRAFWWMEREGGWQ